MLLPFDEDLTFGILSVEHDGSESSAMVVLGSRSLLLVLDFEDFCGDLFLVAIGVLVIKESVTSNKTLSLFRVITS